MEDTKEFDLDATKAVRFEGIVWRAPVGGLIDFSEVVELDCNSPLALAGMESRGYVGMVKLRVEPDVTGSFIVAEGILEYGSPERLLLETEELAIDLEVYVGAVADASVPLEAGMVVPRTLSVVSAQLKQVPTGTLKQVPMSWLF